MAVESADDLAGLFSTEDFGIEATWSHGGTSVTIDVILSSPTMSTRGVTEVETIGAEACLRCAVADLPAGAGQGDTVAVAGRDYTVKSYLPTGDGICRVYLEPAA